MTRKLITATALATAALAAAPAVAAAAPVQITAVTLSPSCVQPGQNVTANVTVQNTTYYPQVFYAQGWVSVGGQVVQRTGVGGPYGLPAYATLTQGQTQQVPYYTPWGQYTVTAAVGPSSSDPASYSQRSAILTVSPFCF
jgi:hypothetical protein